MNNSPFHRVPAAPPVDRREFLWRSGGGLGGIALAALLGRQNLLAAPPTSGVLHFAPKAKRVVQLFMAGAASHVDMWDRKPELTKRNGEKWNPGESVELFQSGVGATFASPWQFRPYGRSGKMLSEIVAPLGEVVDDIAFIHNLTGKSGVHSQATLLQTTGFVTPGFPGMGAWVSYGLGSLDENLPTFVVLPDLRGFPSNGQKNWDSAFLPGQHAGTTVRVGAENPIEDLFPPKADFITPAGESAGLALLSKLNRVHASERSGDSRLDARVRSYELAARMQLAAPEALDLSKESPETLASYGIDNSTKKWPSEINVAEETDIMGRKCLSARRLLERGVRFVQIWSGCDNGFPRRNWDSHEDISRDHAPLSRSAWRSPPPRSSRTSNSADCSTTPSCCGRRNSAACPAPKAARGATTTRSSSPTGCAAAASRAASATARATSGATSPPTAKARRKSMTSTPPSCTSWASTTNNSPSATTGWTAA